jgi:hypothetical protein
LFAASFKPEDIQIMLKVSRQQVINNFILGRIKNNVICSFNSHAGIKEFFIAACSAREITNSAKRLYAQTMSL